MVFQELCQNIDNEYFFILVSNISISVLFLIVLIQFENYDFDYVIGSVHFLRGWAYDSAEIKAEWQNHSLQDIYECYTEEIETLVNRLDMVKECMVFGMPDKLDANDVQVAVKVVYDEDKRKEKYKDLNDNEFYNYVWEAIKEINKTFPTYKYIKHLILTNEELIKTTTKKIKRQEEIKKILENSIN